MPILNDTNLSYLARHQDDAPTVPCPCGQSTRIITSADTPVANLHVTHITDSRRHYHKRCTEYYYVLAGAGKMEVGPDTLDVVPGSTVVIPANVPHRAYGDLTILIVGVPAFDPADEYFDEPEGE